MESQSQTNTENDIKKLLQELKNGIPLNPLPDLLPLDSSVPHAPHRNPKLTHDEEALAITNALRYFPSEYHELLGKEFLNELRTYGHIYMYRFRPTKYAMKAYPIQCYPAKCLHAAVIQLMIMNNLDPEVAQYPHELITYGGNGSVFQNWIQYHLTMKYLSEMNEEQTLSMISGHPQGLFPSHLNAPRVVLTNGMMIPNYSTRDMYEKLYALGNTMYGQMTAGSYCYIGPQGIVHGTTITLLNAGRKFLGVEDMRGKVYVTSGLGGMSGAQPKAGDIIGCITVVAEINEKALDKRVKQGWVKQKTSDLDQVIQMIKQGRSAKQTTSIAYLGNIVELWEKLAQETEMLVDLGSDQTSLHNPFFGGYYPVGLTLQESNKMMRDDPEKFKECVYASLRRQVKAINALANRGMKFWDYGNCFLLESSRAGADILEDPKTMKFKYNSYFDEFMGNIFGLGFGPFRWVCTSLKPEDLKTTDEIAEEVITQFIENTPKEIKNQLLDNLKWIQKAEENKLVVGSQARILYADTQVRMEVAKRFNKSIAEGKITGPIVLSRDHHDVSGTDSPFRETSDIADGSKYTADMAVQNVIGDSFRGATWVALHNGGGVGWGEVINGGFGLVLDGTADAERRACMMLKWDVNNGVCRRSWSGNSYAEMNIKRQMEFDENLKVTLPNHVDKDVLGKLFR